MALTLPDGLISTKYPEPRGSDQLLVHSFRERKAEHFGDCGFHCDDTDVCRRVLQPGRIDDVREPAGHGVDARGYGILVRDGLTASTAGRCE